MSPKDIYNKVISLGARRLTSGGIVICLLWVAVFFPTGPDGGTEFGLIAQTFVLLGLWFALLVSESFFGATLKWVSGLGLAPFVLFVMYILFDLSSRFAAEGQDFWRLLLTGEGTAREALLDTGSPLLYLGIPVVLLAFLIGHYAGQYLRESAEGKLSRVRALVLLVVMVVSFQLGRYLNLSIPPSVYP